MWLTEGVWCLKELLKLKKTSGGNCCELPNSLYELWVTATAAATADDQTLTHTLCETLPATPETETFDNSWFIQPSVRERRL